MTAAPLGPLLVLTDRRQCPHPLPEVVGAAVDGGARAVVLRERDLPAAGRAALAEQLRALLAPVGGVLVVAGADLPGEAVHLAQRDAVPRPRPALLGRSCHDAGEVARATDEGCDWVTVSPVRLTASKPGHGPALGTAGLAALVGGPPAYALGGLSADDAEPCLRAGAAGVAVMGAVMRASRPDEVVAALLSRLSAGTAP
ncbi:MAG: Thiamin-phosphate pyrophosphorylase [uncultured Frankineae bacterium]|uniref:Thiamin-phosphate pyrophosphorylase n=1 Tax=uncultured Frankineae bacterium TaxID=437475 RepID=A0A6J4LVQ1_9ACTN|nr:MAG: Thiamin-phosphate pyrophosphorylase [uncultured Frankineae bacterium]